MQFQILPLFNEDFPEVTSVWEASVRASHHFLSEADIQFYKPLIASENLPILSLFGIRRASGDITGFIGVADRRIEMLFVQPDDFGKGIGKALCRFAVQELRAWEVDVPADSRLFILSAYKHRVFARRFPCYWLSNGKQILAMVPR